MNQVTTLNYTFAVNNVGVSPDGSMMAVVGDCNQVHVHSISNSGEYKKIGTLSGIGKEAIFDSYYCFLFSG